VTVAGGRRASGKDVRERNRKFGSEAACGSRQMQSCVLTRGHQLSRCRQPMDSSTQKQ
jgi:hypothetical protein